MKKSNEKQELNRTRSKILRHADFFQDDSKDIQMISNPGYEYTRLTVVTVVHSSR